MIEPKFELLCRRLEAEFGHCPELDYSAFGVFAAGTPESEECREMRHFAHPPEELARVHDGRFFNALVEKVHALLLNPVRVTRLLGGEKAIQVLGCAIFIQGKSGQLHTFMWDSDGVVSRIPTRLVMITEIPYGSIWLSRIISTALGNRRTSITPSEQLPNSLKNAYPQWLLKAVLRRVRKQHDLRKLRQRIAHALCIDPDVLRLSHRVPVSSPLTGKACVSEYNQCVRNKAALLEVERVAPRAVGIYAVVCESSIFPESGEPTQRLKRFLSAIGMSSSTWLLILRGGNRLLPMVRQFYAGAAAYCVCDAIVVINGLKLKTYPPAWVLQVIFAEWGNVGEPRAAYRHVMEGAMANLRHFVACVVVEFDYPSQLQMEQLTEVMLWISHPSVPPLIRAQRQGGWKYLLIQARKFHRQREEDVAAERVSWPTPFRTMDLGSMKIVALDSALSLLHESRRMRNCADRYVDRCMDGKELLVSLRTSSGNRLAMARYVWAEQTWSLGEARGVMNQPLDLKTLKLLRQAATRIPTPPETSDTQTHELPKGLEQGEVYSQSVQAVNSSPLKQDH